MFQAENNIFGPIKAHLRLNLASTRSIWIFKRLNLAFKKSTLTFKRSILNKFVHKYQIRPNSTIEIGLCNSKFRNLNEFEWIRPSLIKRLTSKLFNLFFNQKRLYFFPQNSIFRISKNYVEKEIFFSSLIWLSSLHLTMIIISNESRRKKNKKGFILDVSMLALQRSPTFRIRLVLHKRYKNNGMIKSTNVTISARIW